MLSAEAITKPQSPTWGHAATSAGIEAFLDLTQPDALHQQSGSLEES